MEKTTGIMCCACELHQAFSQLTCTILLRHNMNFLIKLLDWKRWAYWFMKRIKTKHY